MDMALPMAVAQPAVRESAAIALSIEGVHKRFDNKFVALQHVDLEVRQGEMLCLLGPSGCGKTTLLRIIAGLETQTGGRIVQNGLDISWLPPVKRDYGIVFQSYALFPNLTIAQNVAYGLVNRQRPKAEVAARTDELLKLVGLAASGNQYPGQLSGGQQQRIALARALATSPRLLLLDEPLSALDALERIRLRGEIRRLQQQLGVTTIMVTHDQEEALSMADRVAVLSQGRLEQFGSPTDVYDRPETLFVNTFVGSSNRMPGTLVSSDATGAKVRLDAGAEIIARPATKSMTEGGRVTVCIRPEHLQFVTDDSGFAGVVGMALPLGATVVHEVTTADGSGVKISQARLGETRLLESGVAVRIAPLAPALATAFPASI